MKRSLFLFSGIALVMVGMGLIMPAVAQMRDTGALQSVGVGLLLVGIALTGAGCWALFGSFRRRFAAAPRA